MKKTKVFIALAILILILGATACNRQKADESDNNANSLSVNNSGQHIQGQLDTNLSVDADVIAPTGINKVSILRVTPVTLVNKTLETLLLANSSVSQKQDNGDNGTVYKTADGKELYVGRGQVNFQASKFRTYISQILFKDSIPGDAFFNFNRFSKNLDLDLPFMPHQQAVDKVKKGLLSLGISVYDKVETYSLDYQTLQTQEKALKDNGKLTSPKDGSTILKDGWSKEDDCYFMIFRSGFDNLPVYPIDHGTVEANTIVPSSYIYVCYSQKGFEYLTMANQYQKMSTDQEGLKLISAEEALAVVKRKYGNVILTDPTTITGIELNYVRKLINQSRDEFQMAPAWCFEVTEIRTMGDGSKVTAHSRVIIDATNGGEIL